MRKQESVPDETAAERLARDTEACFKKGALVSVDVNDAGCVAFWVKAMSSHVLRKQSSFVGMPEEFVSSLDSYASQYLNFVCTQLLEVEKVSDARSIAAEMKGVIAKCELLTPFGKVLMDFLSDSESKEPAEWSRKAETLSLSNKGELFRSKLWAALLMEKQSGKVKELKALTQNGEYAEFLTEAENVRLFLARRQSEGGP